MRLVSYRHGGAPGLALVIDGELVDAVALGARVGVRLDANRDNSLMRQLLTAGSDAIERLQHAAENQPRQIDKEPLLVTDVEVDVPIRDPEKVICVGLNWESHADEVEMPRPETPTLFAKFANSLWPEGASLTMPDMTAQLDYEGELAVVIGKDCHDVPAERAYDVIAGYMCFNDISARDLQMATSQWLPGKALDGFAPCGPFLVTRDEVPDPTSLRIRTLVNGNVVQDDLTANMIFPISEIIAYLSRLMTLRVGDVIATGTPPGVGMATSRYLCAGDVVRVEIDQVGVLTTPIVAGRKAVV